MGQLSYHCYRFLLMYVPLCPCTPKLISGGCTSCLCVGKWKVEAFLPLLSSSLMYVSVCRCTPTLYEKRVWVGGYCLW